MGKLVLMLCFIVEVFAKSEKVPLCDNVKSNAIVCAKVKDYNHHKVPKKPTEVMTEVNFRGIHDIDEEKHKVTFLADFSIGWNDERITINQDISNETIYIKINHLKSALWIPELYFPNTVETKKAEVKQEEPNPKDSKKFEKPKGSDRSDENNKGSKKFKSDAPKPSNKNNNT